MASTILPKIKIGPSILNANLANLSEESRHLLKCGADYLHLDVMDGQFVPNLTFGHTVVKCLRKDLGKETFFDLHMMVADPLRWIEPMADAGCTQYTYHFESTEQQELVIRRIREAGMMVGLAIKPNTSVETILPFVESVDMVLVMTVEPGFGGQKFMSDMMPKVRALREKYRELGKFLTFDHQIVHASKRILLFFILLTSKPWLPPSRHRGRRRSWARLCGRMLLCWSQHDCIWHCNNSIPRAKICYRSN